MAVYADYNGSAPISKEVLEYLDQRLNNGLFGNPNAIHVVGNRLINAINKCRKIIAEVIGCEASQIIFNSGASEGISHIFFSAYENRKNRNVMVVSAIEHSAVIKAAKFYAGKGIKIVTAPVTEEGVLDLNQFQNIMKEHDSQVALVAIMAANNETGVIQPINDIAQICNRYQAPFFSDTTQFIGKHEFHFAESGIDFAVCSSHKIGSLIGSGFLIAKEPTSLSEYIFGGGQENGMRGGTQNYLGIEAMTVALQSFQNNISCLEKIKQARELFENKIKNDFPETIILGLHSPRLAATTLISYPGLHGQAVQIELESQDIYTTTSSACSDNEPETSKVLKAMGIDDKIGRGVVRISLGECNVEKNYEMIYQALKNAYKKLVKIESF